MRKRNFFKWRKHYSGYGLNTLGIAKLNNSMDYMASKCVKEDFKSVVLFKADIFVIVNCLRKDVDTREFAKAPIWKLLWTEAKLLGFTLTEMLPHEVINITNAIEEHGKTREEFQTMNELIRWYGIERERIKILKDFTPKDDRQRYESSYDGPENVISDSVWMDGLEENEEELDKICCP